MNNPQDEKNRKFLDFLIADHGLKYQCNTENGDTIYASNTIIIEGYVDRYIPVIFIKRPSEPDYVKIYFGVVLETLGIITDEEFEANLRKNRLDENKVYLRSLFQDVANVVMNAPESWWLDAQKLKFQKEENFYISNDQDPTWKESHRKWYRYIKSYDPSWESQIPVPDDNGA